MAWHCSVMSPSTSNRRSPKEVSGWNGDEDKGAVRSVGQARPPVDTRRTHDSITHIPTFFVQRLL